MYYAGLRPEEAVAVALPDCRLPTTGWGRLIVHRTLPQAGKRWTDTGQYHDERGLKNRPPGETRVVPLPPHLVALWRESVTTFGTADDGRLFFTEQGRIISYTTYHRVWHETRALACLPPSPTRRSRSARTTCGTRRCPPGRRFSTKITMSARSFACSSTLPQALGFARAGETPPVGEQAMAILKGWRLLRRIRCSTTRITGLVRAVLALHLAASA